MRNSCDRAYLLTLKEDEARTIDIMRVLLAYGFDPLNGSVVNQSLLKQKSVKTVVRKLLHEVVKLSSVPIDPNLPPPIIKRPPPKVKQPPPPPKKRVGRDDIEMKKGDWLCPKYASSVGFYLLMTNALFFCDTYVGWTIAEEAFGFCATHHSTHILKSFYYFFFHHMNTLVYIHYCAYV